MENRTDIRKGIDKQRFALRAIQPAAIGDTLVIFDGGVQVKSGGKRKS